MGGRLFMIHAVLCGRGVLSVWMCGTVLSCRHHHHILVSVVILC